MTERSSAIESDKLFFEGSEGKSICGIIEKPNKDSKKIVIIVHGFSSSKKSWTGSEMSKLFNQNNINSFRLDLNGCGESEGSIEEQTISNTIIDVLKAINFLKDMGYTKIGLLGSSAGGLTSLNVALQSKDIYKLALKAPVSDYPTLRMSRNGKEYIDEWEKTGWREFKNANGQIHKQPFSFYEDTQQYVMYDKVKELIIPTLILHGTADNTVSIEQSRTLIKNFPSAKLIELENADHSLAVDNSREKSNQILLEWFL